MFLSRAFEPMLAAHQPALGKRCKNKNLDAVFFKLYDNRQQFIIFIKQVLIIKMTYISIVYEILTDENEM